MASAAVGTIRSIAHTLEAVTSECGHFKKEWARKGAEDSPLPRLWKGEWRSHTNSHFGELRCVLQPEGEDQVTAFFRAKYSRFLRACYKVKLAVEPTTNGYKLSGETDLGALAGGKYDYEGEIKGGNFECRYKCKYDQGVFKLSAVPPENG
jgi:hypothetical protein